MTDIVWEDPPKAQNARGTRGAWLRRLSPVTKRPGKWARVYVSPTSNAANNAAYCLRRRFVEVPSGYWEFRAHKTFVYARYLGATKAEARRAA